MTDSCVYQAGQSSSPTSRQARPSRNTPWRDPQCAIYAHSWRYDIEKQERLAYLPEHEVSTSQGLLIHLPAGKAKCDLYLLDLDVGWTLAKTATQVRAVYKSKPLQKYNP